MKRQQLVNLLGTLRDPQAAGDVSSSSKDRARSDGGAGRRENGGGLPRNGVCEALRKRPWDDAHANIETVSPLVDTLRGGINRGFHGGRASRHGSGGIDARSCGLHEANTIQFNNLVTHMFAKQSYDGHSIIMEVTFALHERTILLQKLLQASVEAMGNDVHCGPPPPSAEERAVRQ